MSAELNLEQLKALALAATPGPWQWDGRKVDDDGYVHIPECSYIVGGISLAFQHEDYQRDCDFIAAANPATVLALIAEIERLRDDRHTAVKEAWRANVRASSALPASMQVPSLPTRPAWESYQQLHQQSTPLPVQAGEGEAHGGDGLWPGQIEGDVPAHKLDLSFVCAHLASDTAFDAPMLERAWDALKNAALAAVKAGGREAGPKVAPETAETRMVTGFQGGPKPGASMAGAGGQGGEDGNA